METWPGRTGTKSRTAPVAVSCSRSWARSVTTCQLTGRKVAGGDPLRPASPRLRSPPDQERRCYGRQSLAAAGEAQAVGRGGRHRHGRAQQPGQQLLRLGAARADFRTVSDDLDGGVAQAPPAGPDEIGDVAQHVGPADAGPPGLVDTEHAADIAEPGCGQQRVAQRVRGDVAVGVSGAAVSVGEKQAEQPTWPPPLDRVHVGAQTDPDVHWLTIACANRRSSRVVILKASGSPSTT